MIALLTLPSSLLVNPTPPSTAAGATPDPAISRRAVVQGAGALLAAGGSPYAALAYAGGVDGSDVRGANAKMPKGEKEVSKFLQNLGFPGLKVPNGFSPLAAYIGSATPANIDGIKVKDRAFSSTLLVRMLYPSGWLVETPSITDNGESGNIGANNYGKGDSANFAASPLPAGGSLESLSKNKEFFKSYLSSQMSNDVYEDVKIKKIRPVTQADGTEMLLVRRRRRRRRRLSSAFT